jgi:2,3-bisphosphoglycerate-dependent phosphoglycerate mutase
MKRALVFALLFACCLEVCTAQTTVFIVRHAEKAQDGDAKDPDLSEVGKQRAAALAAMLKDAGVQAIFATEFKRTQQTAEPLARALGISLTVVPAKETAELVTKLKETNGNALVVAHSNTVPELISAFGVAEPVTIGEADYDNLFAIFRGEPARFLRLHLPPGPSGGDRLKTNPQPAGG